MHSLLDWSGKADGVAGGMAMKPEKPNHAMERTADRRTLDSEMIPTLPLRATRALVRRRSSCSR